MNALLGPFHPHLENALVAAIEEKKAKNRLTPLLVLVPSDALRRRLKLLLAREKGLTLIGVHLLTFHQLYLRLFAEHQGRPAPRLTDEGVIEEALGYWIRSAGPRCETFLMVADKAGGCAALRQTLRDLRDGAVDPEALSRAVGENLFDDRDREKLAALADLHAGFLDSCNAWGFCDYADFVLAVHPCVGASPFLKQFEAIFYYGFYDLTQAQLEIFREIARSYPTTLLFPLIRGHPAWEFAGRFYERYIQGLVAEEEVLCAAGNEGCSLALFSDPSPPGTSLPPARPTCAILSCSGPRDEFATVAKEILRLRQAEGMRFAEIGVVGRTLDPYTQWVKEVFRDHRIPITTSAEEPLLQSPLAKSVLLLLQMAGKDYPRHHFVDLISSPYFNISAFAPENQTPRPDIWDLLTRRIGITKGADEWARLQLYLNRDLELETGRDDNDENRKIRIPAAQVAILWRLFGELHHELSGLPAEATWSFYVDAWKNLLDKYLGIRAPVENHDDWATRVVRRGIFETLSALSDLDSLEAPTSLLHFVEVLTGRLERQSVPIAEANIDGVAVLDAMAARGLRFRALFIIGLNEGLFPRTVREDAFLRDRSRSVVETALGYKVGEKLAAFDEEKLLLTLLVGAAGERLYCLYQRSDETGASLQPSWYLTELRQVFGAEPVPIPRSDSAKTHYEPFRNSNLLLPEELAIRLTLQGHDPGPLLDHFPPVASLWKSGARLLEIVENADAPLSAYDGLTGHLSDYWTRLSQEGIAPTALERYARCPFQFFALNVLGLQPQERPEEQSFISPTEIGQLLHWILKEFFQELIERGYFSRTRPELDIEALAESVAGRVFRQYELEHPTGYPLVWQIRQREVLLWLKETVATDLRQMLQSDRQPVALETELTDRLPSDWPAPASSLTLRGRLDRIDFDPCANQFRVIDYKFKSGKKPASADTDLIRAALRGERLQPPIYTLLAQAYAKAQKGDGAAVEAAFYFIAPRWKDGPLLQKSFSATDWDGATGQSLKQTMALLINGIHAGRHFIRPSAGCAYCEVSEVCRKDHLPTVWRTTKDLLAAPHFELAKKEVLGDDHE